MKIKKNRALFIEYFLDKNGPGISIDQRAVFIEQYVQVFSPGFEISKARISGVDPSPAYVFFSIETAEELVYLLGLGIEYSLVPFKRA